MSDMTQQEALAEAQRRWGTTAWVQRTPLRNSDWRSGTYYSVGYQRGSECTLYGNSEVSWEAAFADADRREKENG